MKCDHFFDALMIITPWAVFFDGFTAWTVNHMDIVPDMVNRIAHLLFFLTNGSDDHHYDRVYI